MVLTMAKIENEEKLRKL